MSHVIHIKCSLFGFSLTDLFVFFCCSFYCVRADKKQQTYKSPSPSVSVSVSISFVYSHYLVFLYSLPKQQQNKQTVFLSISISLFLSCFHSLSSFSLSLSVSLYSPINIMVKKAGNSKYKCFDQVQCLQFSFPLFKYYNISDL